MAERLLYTQKAVGSIPTLPTFASIPSFVKGGLGWILQIVHIIKSLPSSPESSSGQALFQNEEKSQSAAIANVVKAPL